MPVPFGLYVAALVKFGSTPDRASRNPAVDPIITICERFALNALPAGFKARKLRKHHG